MTIEQEPEWMTVAREAGWTPPVLMTPTEIEEVIEECAEAAHTSYFDEDYASAPEIERALWRQTVAAVIERYKKLTRGR